MYIIYKYIILKSIKACKIRHFHFLPFFKILKNYKYGKNKKTYYIIQIKVLS